MTHVLRTCTELCDGKDGEKVSATASGKPLAEFRECAAYVLLGDPGMGKTTAFEVEDDALGESSIKIDARDFITFDPANRPKWEDKILFIDGLDEIRAGEADLRTPLDAIRRNLDKLGKPHFRLSCRHADWLEIDRKSLEAVSASGSVKVLRLDPLDASARAELIKDHKDQLGDAYVFLAEAERRRMAGLLDNPQTLDLLVQVVRHGDWPESRKQTFEQACLKMAEEYNEEHQSIRPGGDPRRIVDTAGTLCTLLLISGARGFATTRSQANDDYPHIGDCVISESEWRQAIASNLFRCPDASRVEPVHRHIAEYLAGRHLAHRVGDGLPILRALALISGADGTVVSELRGMSAWLAAHSQAARQHLFDRDAIGVSLYGDIGQFAYAEKRALFHALLREPRQLGKLSISDAAAFASLATPAMLDVLRDALDNPPGGDDAPLAVEFVLCLLREAPPLPEFAPVLPGIVRDSQRWPRVRVAALDALIHYCAKSSCDRELLALLRDIRDNRLDDPDDELLGKLLVALYPWRLESSAIWRYFKESRESLLGHYRYFWSEVLPKKALDNDVADLLDACGEHLPELELAGDFMLSSGIAKLLVRGLHVHGENIGDHRLYSWLDAGSRLIFGRNPNRPVSAGSAIRTWIQEHPNRHAGLLLEGFRHQSSDDSELFLDDVLERLFGVTPSADVCIAVAQSLSRTQQQSAESLLWFAVRSNQIDLERVRERVVNDSTLTKFLDMLAEPAQPRQSQRQQRRDERLEEKRIIEKRQREHLRANIASLRSNQAPPAMLYRIAQTYFDNFVQFTSDQGIDRLKELAVHDEELLDAMKTGLRLAADREDIPDVDAIVEQYLDHKMDRICWPYLAGLEMSRNRLSRSWWTQERMRKALAIYFAYPPADYKPAWYEYLVDSHADTVATVLIDLAKAAFGIASANIWPLAFDSAHAEVARHAALPLLRMFPAKAESRSLGVFEQLLLAAVQYADHAELENLIRERIARKSMSPYQRGRWISAGCIVSADAFADDAREFVCQGRQQQRVLHLASLFFTDYPAFPMLSRSTVLATLMIQLVGRFNAPPGAGHGFVTPSMKASNMVSTYIRTLGSSPDADATAALEELVEDSELLCWRHALTSALDEQRIIRRDQEYRHPTFDEVREALAGGLPANAGDLAALVLHHLDHIAVSVKSGDTDDWKQYWNEDPNGKPTQRKREESCTNALLRELRRLLSDGLQAAPEVRYVNNARADISVFRDEGCYIPLEIKCNDNAELWTAAQDQLLAKYASDPATGGFGIYVVLWFGSEYTKRSPQDGTRPATPNALRQALEATLPERHKRFIHIRVIDVSTPPATASAASPPTRS